MGKVDDAFMRYCCELLGSLGVCSARRMFGGWGIRAEGLNVALVADLGEGEKLWLKADAVSQQAFEAAGCERFSYRSQHRGESVQRGLNYYAPPADAMESPAFMAGWARLALEAALRAAAAKRPAQGALDSKRPSTRPRPATRNSA
jgi:DNA transformation protein